MLINEPNSFSYFKKKGKLIDNKFDLNEDLERTIYQLHLEYNRENRKNKGNTGFRGFG